MVGISLVSLLLVTIGLGFLIAFTAVFVPLELLLARIVWEVAQILLTIISLARIWLSC